jgi:hypothetical protein
MHVPREGRWQAVSRRRGLLAASDPAASAEEADDEHDHRHNEQDVEKAPRVDPDTSPTSHRIRSTMAMVVSMGSVLSLRQG